MAEEFAAMRGVLSETEPVRLRIILQYDHIINSRLCLSRIFRFRTGRVELQPEEEPCHRRQLRVAVRRATWTSQLSDVEPVDERHQDLRDLSDAEDRMERAGLNALGDGFLDYSAPPIVNLRYEFPDIRIASAFGKQVDPDSRAVQLIGACGRTRAQSHELFPWVSKSVYDLCNLCNYGMQIPPLCLVHEVGPIPEVMLQTPHRDARCLSSVPHGNCGDSPLGNQLSNRKQNGFQ